MKVESQTIAPCKVKLSVELGADEIREDYKKVVQIFQKNGQVKGFRRGKIPRDLLLKMFDAQIKEETIKNLIDRTSKDALKEANVKVVELLNIEDVKFDLASGLSYAITLDVRPEFDMPKYKGIPLANEPVTVSDEDIDKRIAEKRDAFSTYLDEDKVGEDHLIQSLDLVQIDFDATSDGKPLVELTEKAKALSSGRDFWMQVNDDHFIPEVVNALKGLRKGESTEVKFTFGEDCPLEELRNKPAQFNLTVKTVRARVLPSDEELLKHLQKETMDALRDDFRKQIENEKTAAEKSRRTNSAFDYLLEKAGEFEIPDSQLSKEVNRLVEITMDNAIRQGVSREALEGNREKLLESATAEAKRNCRLMNILVRISEEEKLSPTAADFTNHIAKMSEKYQIPQDQLLKYVKEKGLMDSVANEIFIEKISDFLLAESKEA